MIKKIISVWMLLGASSLLACAALALFEGGNFYDLEPVLKQLGIPGDQITEKRIPVLVDPLAGYVRFYVTRTAVLGRLRLEVSEFENQIGLSQELVEAAKQRGIWHGSLWVAPPPHSLGPGDFISILNFQNRFIDLPLEQLSAIQSLSTEIQNQALEQVNRSVIEIAEFVKKHEKRRHFSPELESRIENNSKVFAGSTTSIVIRDNLGGQIVAVLKFIRAPFGGRTEFNLEAAQVLLETHVGGWGPNYKNLAAPSLAIIATPDEQLYLKSRAYEGYTGEALIPRMAWETYVPSHIKIDRRRFAGELYRTGISASGSLIRYWQHEFIEPSGFALDQEYAERHQAYAAIARLVLSQLLDPNYSQVSNFENRTYFFPNDRRGSRLFSRFNFVPVSAEFELFGMPHWRLFSASGKNFARGVADLLKANPDELNAEVRSLMQGL